MSRIIRFFRRLFGGTPPTPVPVPLASGGFGFTTAMAFVELWEGGLVDDPHDAGGITKFGITLRTLLSKALDLNNDGVVDRRDILDLTREQAQGIYYRDYWVAAACPRLPDPLALVVFDCAVNQGVGRATRILQRSVQVTADGIIGARTLAAVQVRWSSRPRELISEFCARRARHYSSLSQVIRYGLGWFRRLFAAQATALGLV